MKRMKWTCMAVVLTLVTGNGLRSQIANAQPAAVLEPSSKVCPGDAGEANRTPASLPNTARALRDRKRIKVLAMGTTPLNERDQVNGPYALVEKALESGYKGLDVEIVDRGVSGEIARDGAERIRTEVALLRPDLVFWQVGVADALALTPPAELKATLTQTVQWLKAHDVDVVLIGLRYVRSIARDGGYQQLRAAIADVVRDEAILRVGHYAAVEAIDRLRRQQGETPSELDLTDAGSTCVADFLSRALAVGLFAKPRATLPGIAPQPGPGLAPAPPPVPGSGRN